MTIIARRKFLYLLCFSHSFEALRRAVAMVGMSRSDKLTRILLVETFALHLVIWSVETANHRALVDIHAKPCETIDKIINGNYYCACHVGIFNAQNELATSMACVEPAKERGAECTDVQKASGAWRKTKPWHLFSSCQQWIFNTVVSL